MTVSSLCYRRKQALLITSRIGTNTADSCCSMAGIIPSGPGDLNDNGTSYLVILEASIYSDTILDTIILQSKVTTLATRVVYTVSFHVGRQCFNLVVSLSFLSIFSNLRFG